MEKGFVNVAELIPDALMDIRYATGHNLTGHPLKGYYAPKAILTEEAGAALKKAADKFREMGYGIMIYDAYRPTSAVEDFFRWSKFPEDYLTQKEYYPDLDKDRLFAMGYIALRSGHSRGSTVDLTLTRDGQPLDMGTTFDFMNELSYQNAAGLTAEQQENRALLRGVMCWAGFAPYSKEWWHFTLMGEPWPNTYFDFPIEP